MPAAVGPDRPARRRERRADAASSSRSAAGTCGSGSARCPSVTCVRPQGAFYCFPNVSAYFGKSAGGAKITDAVSFAAALLEQSHVAVVPGNDSGFDTHVRLSFATSMEQIDKGIDRIAEFLRKLE